MKKVAIAGERRAEVVEVPDPQPREDWVVVKVHAAPLCTEYKLFVAGRPSQHLGHEAAGEVVAVARPGRVRVGDRVVAMPLHGCGRCWLCLAGDYIHCEHRPTFVELHGSLEGSGTVGQYILKPDWLLPAIPAGVSYRQASLACCALGPSFGAFELMGLSAAVAPTSTVLITGAGPVGLGAVVNARFRGARVVVAESVPYRVERAQAMGATVVDPHDPGALAQVRELTDGRGVDFALDCSGNVQAERFCLDATRRKGTVAYVGESEEPLAVRVSPDFLRKGLTLIGSWHYNLGHFPAVMQVVQESPLIEGLVSHVLPLSRAQEALELSASHQTAKVILEPWA